MFFGLTLDPLQGSSAMFSISLGAKFSILFKGYFLMRCTLKTHAPDFIWSKIIIEIYTNLIWPPQSTKKYTEIYQHLLVHAWPYKVEKTARVTVNYGKHEEQEAIFVQINKDISYFLSTILGIHLNHLQFIGCKLFALTVCTSFSHDINHSKHGSALD